MVAGSDNALAVRSVKETYTVSRIVREARGMLVDAFPLIWVEGEVSNLAMPASGHIYFVLKDKLAQVRCAMFRNYQQNLRFTPENGMQLLVRARVTLYEKRGEFQLVAEHIEEAGSGALQRAYEALKQRLAEQGLFAKTHKQPLPSFPRTIGVISSPDAAAVHDILTVLNRRFPATDVIVYPALVQGKAAAKQIIEAVLVADKRRECDVLIISRGGGSLEDLWSFNDEKLAHTVFACKIPIISAVGHEIDFTIIDFVADVRASTPSAAAEMVVPDKNEYFNSIDDYSRRLRLLMGHYLNSQKRYIYQLKQRLSHPTVQIDKNRQRLEHLAEKLRFVWTKLIKSKRDRLRFWRMKLKHPQDKIILEKLKLKQCNRRLHNTIQHVLQHHKTYLGQQMHTLKVVSPLNTLERGYSITLSNKDGHVLTKVADTKIGDSINVRLNHGTLDCQITKINDD